MSWILSKLGCVDARAVILVAVASTYGTVSNASATEIDLGEYTLNDKQLRQAVYGRGFNIGLDEKAIDKLMEIQQHLQSAQWVKAFRIIDANRALWAGKQVPRQDGFTLPVDEFLSRLIGSLPAEARESFDSYFSARAQQLLERTDSLAPEEEIAQLRRLQTFYSLTSSGSESANRLGDAYFERGRFRQAASVWEALIREHAVSLDVERRVLGKLLLAYSRTGNREQLTRAIQTLSQRFAGSTIKLGPDEQSVEDFVAQFSGIAPGDGDRNEVLPAAGLPANDTQPVWSISWISDQRKSGLPAATPDVRFDGNRIVLNHGWAVASYGLENGKTIWNNGLARKKKGNLLGLVKRIAQEKLDIPVVAGPRNDRQQNQFGTAERQSVTNGMLTFVQRVDKQQNVTILAFESDTGKLAWTSGSDAEFKIAGNLVVWQDVLVAAAYSVKSQSELHLLFYDMDGNVRSTQRLGTVVGISNPYQGTSTQPSPTLVNYDQYVLVMPNDGAVIAIDPESQDKIDWMYRFSPARTSDANARQMLWSGMPTPKTYIRPSAVVRDDILYFRDDEDRTLHAMNPAKRQVLWERSMGSDAEILGVDDHFVYVLEKESNQGHTLQMIDRETK